MNIKSDHEAAQRWHTHHWIENFDADLSMMVSRPYEANLGRKKPSPKNQIRKNIFVGKFASAGSRPDPAGQGSSTGGRGGQERAKEGQIRAI